jgi:tetratricopeptide (TPR) repeat protein
VLNEGRPDPQFTRRVVEEALRRAEQAANANAMGDALRYYDKALVALDRLDPDEAQRRLKMEALQGKGAAARFPRSMDEAVRLWEQSLALAGELGDRKSQADQLLRIAGHTGQPDLAEQYRRRALAIYRDLGDAAGQGECLFWFCTRSLGERDAPSARRYCEQALPLLEAAGDPRLTAVCRAILSLLDEVGEPAFPMLLSWNASCDILEQQNGILRFGPHSDFRGTPRPGPLPPGLALLRARTLFAHLAPLSKLLDATAPVGASWSGDTWSYSSQPLQTVLTVKSASEQITVPAGTFENCLLMELTTSESTRPDDTPEENRRLNRESLCGTRQAWYAPGVGLVQLRVQTEDSPEANCRSAALERPGPSPSAPARAFMLQLQEFSLTQASPAYLPLALRNTWTYTAHPLPSSLTARELYQITAQDEDRWLLQSYGYLRES